MALTFGFYDAISGDRAYNAEQMSSMFDGIINNGVYNSIGEKFMVYQSDTPGMSAKVGSGRAWFDHTWSLNDDWVSVSFDASHALLNRIDIVYLQVNSDVGVRANSIGVLKGTPASAPVPPTLSATATLHQYALAHVYIAAASTEVLQASITNKVGTTGTPYVTGIIESIPWQELMDELEDRVDSYFDIKRVLLQPEDPIVSDSYDTDDPYTHAWRLFVPLDYVSGGKLIVYGEDPYVPVPPETLNMIFRFDIFALGGQVLLAEPHNRPKMYPTFVTSNPGLPKAAIVAELAASNSWMEGNQGGVFGPGCFGIINAKGFAKVPYVSDFSFAYFEYVAQVPMTE